MKKYLLIALAMVMAIMTVACTTTTEPAATEAPAATEEPAAAEETAAPEATEAAVDEIAWPEKEITLITDQEAGSAGDTLTREYATLFSKYSGATVIVENTSGGSGVLALNSLLGKDADGYTFFQQSSTMPLTLATGTAPYTPEEIQPLASISRDTFYLSVAADSKFNSFEELLAYSLEHPGELNGAGNSSKGVVEFYAQMVKKVTGLDFNYVPYASANESKVGVMGGDSDILFLSRNLSLADAQAGNLKPLASTRDTDDPDIDVPSFESLGYSELSAVTFWRGIFCKAGTDEAVMAKFMEIHAQVVADNEWIDFLATQNLEVYNLNTEDFTELFYETYNNGVELFAE